MTTSASPYVLSTGDIDGDGDLDLLTGDASNLNVYRNNGTGIFTATATVPQTGNMTTLADLDGDGDLDLLQQNSRGQSVKLAAQ